MIKRSEVFSISAVNYPVIVLQFIPVGERERRDSSGSKSGAHKVDGRASTSGKNRRIAESQKQTRERRKNKDILVRTVKIQRNKLSRTQLEALERLFLEGKWFYNTALAHGRFDEEFRKNLCNTVEVKPPTGEIERRPLTVLCG